MSLCGVGRRGKAKRFKEGWCMDPACILDQAKEKKQTSTGGETNGQNRNVPEKKG